MQHWKAHHLPPFINILQERSPRNHVSSSFIYIRATTQSPLSPICHFFAFERFSLTFLFTIPNICSSVTFFPKSHLLQELIDLETEGVCCLDNYLKNELSDALVEIFHILNETQDHCQQIMSISGRRMVQMDCWHHRKGGIRNELFLRSYC